jgi:hypothetical protein
MSFFCNYFANVTQASAIINKLILHHLRGLLNSALRLTFYVGIFGTQVHYGVNGPSRSSARAACVLVSLLGVNRIV